MAIFGLDEKFSLIIFKLKWTLVIKQKKTKRNKKGPNQNENAKKLKFLCGMQIWNFILHSMEKKVQFSIIYRDNPKIKADMIPINTKF